MAAPFPGMDPFIEGQRFDDFHHAFLITVKEQLVRLLRPRYVVDAERYVFLSGDPDSPQRFRPDVAILEAPGPHSTANPGSVSTLEPRLTAIPDSGEDGQVFLSIRSAEDRRIVTVLELLSPTNKERGGGMQQYLAKRAAYLQSLTSIVELDLLRGGARLPTQHALQPGDYYTFVIRHGDRSHVEVYGWLLSDRLPVIPVPLSEGDSDAGLDLQMAFEATYERSGYDYALDYQRIIAPPVTPAQQEWIQGCLHRP